MKKIILISGKARHGKNEIAEYINLALTQYMGLKVIELAYGDDVKRVAKKAGWNGEKDSKGRTLLQTIGQRGRKLDKDIWVNRVRQEVELLKDYIDIAIITDCRHKNEIEWTKQENNTITLRVNRSGEFDDGLTEEQRKHISETALDDYELDYYIENDGNLYDLANKVIDFLIETGLLYN